MTLVEEVFRLAEVVPGPPGTPLPPGATDSQIDAFVTRQQVTIPPEVREWLRFTDGPDICGVSFGLEDFEEIYGINPEFKERHWLPLGTDGCGDYYVLALDSGDRPLRPVYFIDPYASGYGAPTYAVASGFWQFLRFLFQRELGEPRWPFDAAFVLASDPELAGVKGAPLPWQVD